MSYKNDQFAHMNGESASVASLNTSSRQFKQRDSVVRGIKRETVTANGVTTTGWVPDSFILKKGYIRSLIEKVGAADGMGFADLAKQRCDFQFNPSQLQQDVSMQLNMANIMLQSPAQLAVPLQGEVSFAFELMFDRTDTLNEEAENDPAANSNSSSEPNIGVLADIRALYEIIGQGVSESRMKAQGTVATYLAQGEIINTGGAGVPVSAGLQGPAATDGTTGGLGAEDVLASAFFDPAINIGNSAFLMPLPVRVVFSSLFMVDGYVTNTSVVYTKFSRTLIPLQCIVQLSMTAKYVGFAKQQTFLTDQLAKAEALTAAEIAQRISYGKEVTDTINTSLSKFQVEPLTQVSYEVKKTVNAAGGGIRAITFVDRKRNDTSIAQVLVPDQDYAAVVNDLEDFPLVRAGSSGYSEERLSAKAPVLAPKLRIKVGTEVSDDQFTAMFSQAATSVTLTASISTYGPFSEADADYFVTTEYDLSKTITSPTTPQVANPARLTNLKTKKISEISGGTTFTNVDDLKVLKTGKLLSASRTLLSNKYNYATMVRENNYFVIVSSISLNTVSNGQNASYNHFTKGCIKKSKGSNWGVVGITAKPDPIGVLTNELIKVQ